MHRWEDQVLRMAKSEALREDMKDRYGEPERGE
jgi:hypothetical protein